MNKPKVVSLYGGPNSGKSTIAHLLIGEMKMQGINAEMAAEYAKDKAWEHRADSVLGPKIFEAQQYIYGKQSFRLWRVAHEVQFTVTDSPLLFSQIYTNGELPSLSVIAFEDYMRYDNLDIFVERDTARPFNPKGRIHNREQSIELDNQIKDMLTRQNIPFYSLPFSRDCVSQIFEIMTSKGWLEKA